MIRKLSPFFTEHFLRSLAFTILLIAGYSVVVGYFLPAGITKHFLQREVKLLVPLALGVFGLLGLFIKFLPKAVEEDFTNPEFNKLDFILLLLPLTPIISFGIINKDMESLGNIFSTLVYFGAIALFLSFLPALLLRKYFNYGLLLAASLSFLFVIYYMPGLAGINNWTETGSLKKLTLILVSLSAIAYLAFIFNKKIAYAVVAIYFVSETIFAFIGGNQYIENAKESRIYEPIRNGVQLSSVSLKKTPNIYLLIYDAYPNLETTNLYGIDNNQQMSVLKNKGFTLYEGTYTNGQASVVTMGSILDIKEHVFVDARYVTAGNKGAVSEMLKGNRYKTFGVFESDYFFRGNEVGYDYSLPVAGEMRSTQYNIIKKSILMGEFKFDMDFDGHSIQDYILEKQSVFTKDIGSPKFMYTHRNLPNHTQNSGRCLPHEYPMYIERLKQANIEMIDDLEVAIQSDPNAIVIVAGDHGAYLTKTCTTIPKKDFNKVTRLDVQDRNGAFLAVRWPADYTPTGNKLQTVQDVFPEVFSYLADDPSLFNKLKMPANTFGMANAGVQVKDGIIHGGVHDGEPLFLGVENVPLSPSHPSNNSSNN